jgi:hypothetical protein
MADGSLGRLSTVSNNNAAARKDPRRRIGLR